MVDEWKGFSVSLELQKAALLWRFPVETVSQSESGFEKNYQSSVVFPSWKFALGPNEKWELKILLRIED
jgi:alpha-amylase